MCMQASLRAGVPDLRLLLEAGGAAEQTLEQDPLAGHMVVFQERDAGDMAREPARNI